MKIISFFFCLLFINVVWSQGTVRGVIKDMATNEVIPLSKVRVDGMSMGANADFGGEFMLKLPAGQYKLIFSMSVEGYLDTNQMVLVVDGQEVFLDITLTKEKGVVNLKTVTASAAKKVAASSTKADDERRMDEQGATDGVTDQQMKEKGVNNVADALQTSPGLSVEDGKSVYVRGLGDRYTKTILNGMEIPGLDPDRNAVQLDIFPSSVVDNITVYKTFLPKFAGDFTGGLVDITTKDLPAGRSIYAKASFGYNTAATFNPDFLSYEGGKLDFLGFDDGTRALPVRSTDVFPNVVDNNAKLEERTRQFGQVMAAEKAANFLDQNYTYAYGNRVLMEKNPNKRKTYGYNIVLNYSNQNRYYEDVQFNQYRKRAVDSSAFELENWRSSKGNLGENNVLWTALLGQSISFGRSKITLNLFHTQNAKSSAAQLREEDYEQNPSVLVKQSLQYSQRSVSNLNLSGLHYLDTLSKWRLDWKLSPTYSMINDPDIRSTALQELEELGPNGEVQYDYTQAVGSEIRRIWRYLTEYNVSGRADLTYKFKVWKELESELSFGVLNTYKHRDFEVLDYLFGVENTEVYSGDPNHYFQPENIWSPETDSGTYVIGNKEPANSFSATQNVSGLYVMNELPLSEKFNVTYGARLEKVTNWYTGQNNAGTVVYDNEVVLDELNVLPSINAVYQLGKDADSVHYKRNTNIRGAYSMTLARPSFKEKSIAQIYDPIQGRIYNGNIDLVQTKIHNLDLRWEYFFGRTELISASAFYKRFIDPIEIVSFNTAPNNIQPLNNGVADLYGAEFEMRKALGFAKEKNAHMRFELGLNFTYVLSRINMNEVIIKNGTIERTEKEIREENAREGEVIKDYRPMYGQSPWIVNAYATFRNDSLGFAVNVSYNVQGKKLAVIGIGSLPDVYEQPFHSLNFKISQQFGKNRIWQASITGTNMLMNVRRKFYESYHAQDQIYEYFNEGMSISAGIALTLGDKKNK